MCLILLAYNVNPGYPLIVAANRDEFYERPADALDFWADHPRILAGRDRRQMGTWMGITRGGRFAAVTTFRTPEQVGASAPSRGDLVADFLKGCAPPLEYLRQIKGKSSRFNGFNLLVGDRDGLYYASNHGPWAQPVTPGMHGLSNHLLDTPWPKVTAGVTGLQRLASSGDGTMVPGLFELLQLKEMPPDALLPDTGIGLEWERLLAPIFIVSPTYGTRCSSVLTVSNSGEVVFRERGWEKEGDTVRIASDRTLGFNIDQGC
jgi:uncharacterized protein with NRDE domain